MTINYEEFNMDDIINEDIQNEPVEISKKVEVTKKLKKPDKSKKKIPRKKCTICQKLIERDIFETDEHPCNEIIKKFREKNIIDEPIEEIIDEPIEEKEIKKDLTQDETAQSLFDLQFTVYCMLENSLKIAGIENLDGLTLNMLEMKERYIDIFKKAHDEYGDDIQTYASPIVLWSLLTTQNIGSTFLANKSDLSNV